jgi:hypothetical protein
MRNLCTIDLWWRAVKAGLRCSSRMFSRPANTWKNGVPQLSHEPEKMLMYAVLEHAITCFQKFASVSSARGRAAFKDAENWLMHEKSDWPFSFERICEALNLNPDYIRGGLEHWLRSASPRQTKIHLFYVVRTGRRVRKRSMACGLNGGNRAAVCMRQASNL